MVILLCYESTIIPVLVTLQMGYTISFAFNYCVTLALMSI